MSPQAYFSNEPGLIKWQRGLDYKPEIEPATLWKHANNES